MTLTQGRPGTSRGAAQRLAEALRPFVGGELPVRLRAWDGSVTGPEDAPEVELRSPDAVRRMLRHPGELGAAQAHVTGELEVHGDLGEALTRCLGVARLHSVLRDPVRDVHALREHYVWTVAAWLERFEANLPALMALVGEELTGSGSSTRPAAC